MESMTRSLLLVRHGQIEANARGRWHGSTDSPLTRIGRGQVLRIAQRIRRDWGDAAAIYSSPMIRCLRTAEAIASALDQPVTLDTDLRDDVDAALFERVRRRTHRRQRDPSRLSCAPA